MSSPPDRHRSRVDRAQPDDRLDELRLAVALDAGDRDDLPRANVERHVLDGDVVAIVADHDVVQAEDDIARGRRALHDAELHVATDHHVRELLAGRGLGLSRTGDPAPPEDRDAVTDLEDLVQLVGDEDHGRAVRREPADDVEQLLGLGRREDRRRLVEHEDVALPVERLEDLHPLANTDRQVFDVGVRRDVQVVQLGELDDAFSRGAPVERARVGR